MTTLTGLDYAGGIPRASAIVSAGHSFVCRYLTSGGSGLPGKLIKPAEYAALVAAGVAVVMNWEVNADSMLGGFNAGVADARAADAMVRSLGPDSSAPAIYFSADWDATPGQQSVIDDYLRGCASVIGLERVGVYGSYYVVDRCHTGGTARWFWQAGAWSGGQQHPKAHIYQRIQQVTVDGVECDVNEARVPDYGQHPYTGTTRHHHRENMTMRLAATISTNDGTLGNKSPAVEESIALVGPASGWSGRQVVHVVFGNGGGFVQEAWWAPSGTHIVTPDKPVMVTQFDTQNWEAPAGSLALVLRYAARASGSVTIECEH